MQLLLLFSSALYRIRGNIVITGCNDLAFSMIEMFCGILNSHWFGFGILEWIPNHIKPITVGELRCLVPLVRCEANGLTTAATFHLDAANARNRISISGLRIGRAEATQVKANLQVSDTLALEPLKIG